jgi:hypothetical protein
MQKRSFHVRAVWDEEAKVFYAESDIAGLHIEADTIDEFESLMLELAPELIASNHLEAMDIAHRPLKDWLPAILWERPAAAQH